MTFTVRWKKSARDELANRWINADSALRKAITYASHQIELQLSSDPRRESESRDQNRYVYFYAPLGVLFRIDDENGIVSVLQVWTFN